MNLIDISQEVNSEIEQNFEEYSHVNVENVSPITGGNMLEVKTSEGNISEFDAARVKIPSSNAVFGRVLLDTIQDLNVPTNHSANGFFTMSKDNYLAYVLNQKDVPSPNMVVCYSEKSSRNLSNHLDYPVVAKRIVSNKTESTKILTGDEDAQEFASEGGKDTLSMFYELNRGKKYRLLLTSEFEATIEEKGQEQVFTGEDLQYSTAPKQVQETARKAKRAVGAKICEVKIRNGEVTDMKPNPDLEEFRDVTGKDSHKAVCRELKEQ